MVLYWVHEAREGLGHLVLENCRAHEVRPGGLPRYATADDGSQQEHEARR